MMEWPEGLTHKQLLQWEFQDEKGILRRPYAAAMRWRRFLLRKLQRSAWHFGGLLLWLLQRPQLRPYPIPYPSVTNCDEYQRQLSATAPCPPEEILLDLIQLRNKLGLGQAFLEQEEVLRAIAITKRSPGALAALRQSVKSKIIESQQLPSGSSGGCSCCGAPGKKVTGCSCRGGKSHQCLRIKRQEELKLQLKDAEAKPYALTDKPFTTGDVRSAFLPTQVVALPKATPAVPQMGPQGRVERAATQIASKTRLLVEGFDQSSRTEWQQAEMSQIHPGILAYNRSVAESREEASLVEAQQFQAMARSLPSSSSTQALPDQHAEAEMISLRCEMEEMQATMAQMMAGSGYLPPSMMDTEAVPNLVDQYEGDWSVLNNIPYNIQFEIQNNPEFAILRLGSEGHVQSLPMQEARRLIQTLSDAVAQGDQATVQQVRELLEIYRQNEMTAAPVHIE